MNPHTPSTDDRAPLELSDGHNSEVPATSSLPVWLVPALLAGLAAIGGLIVLVGWAAMRPSPSVPIDPVQPVRIELPKVETPIPGPVERKPIVEEDEPEPSEQPLPPPRASVALQRRMPAGDSASEPSAPMPRLTSQEERLQAPLRWTVEPPNADATHVIVPIEVAKVTDAGLPFRVRRLQLAGDAPKSLKLAVTPVVHDDLGSVLDRMGEGYRYTKLRKEDVFSFETLKKHDVVFLTCADLYAQDFQAALPLRKFVANGGTLYASDLRGDLLQAAFPEFRAKTPILPGVPQRIEASVVDPGLQSYLGRKLIPLSFDAPDWRPAPFDPAKVTMCLKGTYRNNLGQTWPAPLLVKFPFQKGTVIFTSFHHTKNDSEVVHKLLEYLVFASVNARSEARVRELLQRSFSSTPDLRPALLNGDKLEGSFHHSTGDIQIALGFENVGAKLKLTLQSPRRQIIEQADQGLFVIDVPNGETGVWRYTVTPLELPYMNLPIVLAVGGAKR